MMKQYTRPEFDVIGASGEVLTITLSGEQNFDNFDITLQWSDIFE